MIKNKKEAYKELLNMLSNELSNAGCNDFEMQDTPENRQFIDEITAYGLGYKSVEDYKNSDEFYEKTTSSRGTIYTSDFMILAQMRKELDL